MNVRVGNVAVTLSSTLALSLSTKPLHLAPNNVGKGHPTDLNYFSCNTISMPDTRSRERDRDEALNSKLEVNTQSQTRIYLNSALTAKHTLRKEEPLCRGLALSRRARAGRLRRLKVHGDSDSLLCFRV